MNAVKFDKCLEKSGRGLSFYLLLPLDKWCCCTLSLYTVTAMISDYGAVDFYIGWDDNRPWIKLRGVLFCPFCGERFEVDAPESTAFDKVHNGYFWG